VREEQQVSNEAVFATFTYDTRHVPITPNGYMTLRKKHMQDYMKRLRYYHSQKQNEKTVYSDWLILNIQPKPVKVFYVGEYGDLRGRPHYHAIILNAHPKDIERAWQYGNTFLGEVTTSSIAYCAKYMQKAKKKPVNHSRADMDKPFQQLSHGIGKNYLVKNNEMMPRWHRVSPERNYVMLNGYKVLMPRYYREKIYNTEELQEELIQHMRERYYIRENEARIKASIRGQDYEEKKLQAAQARRNRLRAKTRIRSVGNLC
jgi:hypothetical protein